MDLKIRPLDLQALRDAVAPEDTHERRQAYCSGNFTSAARCKDWDLRYRWDLLRASRLRLGGGVLAKGDLNLYAYLNDRHIDSALRTIVPPLGAGDGGRDTPPDETTGSAP